MANEWPGVTGIVPEGGGIARDGIWLIVGMGTFLHIFAEVAAVAC